MRHIGMDKMRSRIFVYGDSHTRALSKAITRKTFDAEEFDISVHYASSEKPGPVRGDTPLKSAMQEAKILSGNSIVVLSFLGTLHNVFGLLRKEYGYWIFRTGEEAFDTTQDLQVVPRQIMFDFFLTKARQNGRIPELVKVASVPVVHLMPPPPKGDDLFIESVINKYRGVDVREARVSPAEARLRMWEVECEAISLYCDEIGISLLPPPAQARDSQGFLRLDCYAQDATHANAKYGELVIDQLKQVARSLAETRLT